MNPLSSNDHRLIKKNEKTPTKKDLKKTSQNLQNGSSSSPIIKKDSSFEESKSHHLNNQLEKILIKALKNISNQQEETSLEVRPSVTTIFITGFEWGGLTPHEESGLLEISKHVKNSKSFTWDQENQIFEMIQNMPPTSPLIIVGHSFGGDAAVSIGKRLNSEKNNFRKIDLLITLDSVGLGNDLIPTNVKKNLNFVIDQNLLFNDGPNIAQKFAATQIENHLRKESHSQLDDSAEIQSKILKNIQKIILEFDNKSMSTLT